MITYDKVIDDPIFLTIVSVIGILAFISMLTWLIDAFRGLETLREHRDGGKSIGLKVFIRLIFVLTGGVSILRLYILEPEVGSIILLVGGTIGLVWFVYRRWVR